jgi:hypothetical protein
MYCRAFGLRILGSFKDHEGFDGIMVGEQGAQYHLEFTSSVAHSVTPAPTVEDLLVLYISDPSQWQQTCAQASAAGFQSVVSFNPYWDRHGRTFADPDGYRIVLYQGTWTAPSALGER